MAETKAKASTEVTAASTEVTAASTEVTAASTEVTAASAEETKRVDVWTQMRTVHLPRAQQNEEKMRFVCVNGRRFQVPKGRDVAVPLPVYLALREAERAEESAARYEEETAEAGKKGIGG